MNPWSKKEVTKVAPNMQIFQPQDALVIVWLKKLGLYEGIVDREVGVAMMHVAASVGGFYINRIDATTTAGIGLEEDKMWQWKYTVLVFAADKERRAALMTAYRLGSYTAAEVVILPVIDASSDIYGKRRTKAMMTAHALGGDQAIADMILADVKAMSTAQSLGGEQAVADMSTSYRERRSGLKKSDP